MQKEAAGAGNNLSPNLVAGPSQRPIAELAVSSCRKAKRTSIRIST